MWVDTLAAGSQGSQGTTGTQGISGSYAAQGLQGTQGVSGATLPVNTQNIASGAVYSIVSSDNGKMIQLTNATAGYSGGVQLLSTSGFTVGQNCVIVNYGTNPAYIVSSSIVTLRLAGTSLGGVSSSRTLAQYGVATILCQASNDYIISGSGLS